MVTKPTYRRMQALLLFITLMVIVMSFYFQYYQGLQPCPLCLMQRVCAFLLGAFCLMGLYITTLTRARTVAFLQILFAVFGLFFALRQLWLQHMPVNQTPACMPGLDILIRYFPWQDVFHALFWGSEGCTETSWVWLGLSMAGWSALYFTVLLLASLGIFIGLYRTLKHLTGSWRDGQRGAPKL